MLRNPWTFRPSHDRVKIPPRSGDAAGESEGHADPVASPRANMLQQSHYATERFPATQPNSYRVQNQAHPDRRSARGPPAYPWLALPEKSRQGSRMRSADNPAARSRQGTHGQVETPSELSERRQNVRSAPGETGTSTRRRPSGRVVMKPAEICVFAQVPS